MARILSFHPSTGALSAVQNQKALSFASPSLFPSFKTCKIYRSPFSPSNISSRRFKSLKFNPVRAELSPIEQGKDAAKQTVDLFIRSNMSIGLGSGLISNYAIQYIAEKLQSGNLRNITAVPMSTNSAAEAAKLGIPLSSLDLTPKLNFGFTDADKVEEGTVYAIIGQKNINSFHDCIIKEKKIIEAAEEFLFFVSEENFLQKLNGNIPIYIKRENWLEIAEEIDDIFLGDAEVWRRPTSGEAGPMGGNFPLVTPSGHYVIDLIFSDPFDPVEVSNILDSVEGVDGHGLFIDHAYGVAVAGKNGVNFRTALFKNAFIKTD